MGAPLAPFSLFLLLAKDDKNRKRRLLIIIFVYDHSVKARRAIH
jgi:hypothetical protein